jgi:hypothetical protein
MLEFLEIIVVWIFSLFVFSNLGASIFHLLRVKQGTSGLLFQNLVQILGGMAIFNVVAGSLSLIIPVTTYMTIAIGLISVVLLISHDIRERALIGIRGLKGLSWVAHLGLLTLFGLVLWTTRLPSLNYDSGLYHNQFIMWMNQFPAVPGLANLHERFGFNSHWHLLAASFNGYPFLTYRLNDMGSLLVVVFLATAVEGAQNLIKRNEKGGMDALLALSLIPLYLLARFMTSDTPDLPNSIIGFTVLTIPFYKHWANQDRLFVLAIVGGLLVSIKVSSVFLLAVAFPSLVGVNWKRFAGALVIGLMILSPWLVRNHTFSGYLVYPAKFTAVGSADYQAPVESLDYVNALLESHGKFGRYDVDLVDRPVSEWGHIWLGHQTTAIKLILALCVALFIVFLLIDAYRTFKSRFGYSQSVDLSIHLVFLLSMAIVFKLAPEIRYAYGVLLFYFVYLLWRLGLSRFKWGVVAASVVGFLMFLRIVFIISNEPPAPILSKTYQTMEGNALPIYYPTEFDQCWEHELPCTNRYIEGLEMRTKELKDGFRIRN